MSDYRFSPFMEYIIESATQMAKNRGEGSPSEEDIFVLIVYNTLLAKKGDDSLNHFSKQELEVLAGMVDSMGSDVEVRLATASEIVTNKPANPFNTPRHFNSLLVRAINVARSRGSNVITADIMLNCILENPSDLISDFVSGKELTDKNSGANSHNEADVLIRKPSPVSLDSSQPDTVYVFGNKSQQSTGAEKPVQHTEKPQMSRDSSKTYLSEQMAKIKYAREKILENVFGQDHAVNCLVQGLFKAAIADVTEKERTRPRITYLFAGPPGVGKTFLSKQFSKHMGFPDEDFKCFDMSDYSDKESFVVLFGSDGVYQSAKPGQLTSYVKEHPKCVLLFDEIEKAHLNIIHQFLQILDAGRCLDQHTREYISFTDTIIIFTSNAGRDLYENSEQTTYADVPVKVIINALKKDIDPTTNKPFFPEAICSRFATGNVVMFNHMQAEGLINLAKRNITKHVGEVEDMFGFNVTVDELVYPSVLYAEGGLADARTVSSRSKLFFDNEFFELLRLVGTDECDHTVSDIENIRVEVSLPADKPDVSKLFVPESDVEILVYTDDKNASLIKAATDKFIIHTATDYEDAVKKIKDNDIRVVLCDFYCGDSKDDVDYINIEDRESDGRSLFRYVTKETDLPLYIIETPENPVSSEERVSLSKEGASGYIRNLDDKDSLSKQMTELGMCIHYRHSLKELARANKMVKFSTGQTISDDGKTATITLFDYFMDVAVDAEDKDSILGKLSKPDVKFGNVRGADDAKKELQFFIDYLKNPRRYASSGISTPKGILLYGPPGTGKTLLAKATAGESDVTFINQEGNEFLKGGAGQGKKAVHDLFALARKYAPAIVFIDEIDAIAKERTGIDSDREATLTAFLTEMDGFKTDPSRPVFVLAATNFDVTPGTPKSLDSAFLRRFDRRMYIGLPSKENREEHLRDKISENPMFEIGEDTIKNIALRSVGQSLANLDSVLDLALRTALSDGKRKVTDDILDDAFEGFNGGETVKYNKESILRTARHEAGHTLACWYSGETPSYVTIVSRGGYGGYMMHDDKEDDIVDTKKDVINRIRTSLAGRAAEILYYGEEGGLSTGPSGDLRNATSLALHMICTWGMSEEFGLSVIDINRVDATSLGDDVRKVVNDLLKRELRNVTEILRQNKAKLDALVDALLERSQLTGKEITEVFESAE